MKRACTSSLSESFLVPGPSRREDILAQYLAGFGARASSLLIQRLPPRQQSINRLTGMGGPVAGPLDLLPSSSDFAIAEMPLPFFSERFPASVEAIVDALSEDIRNDELGKIERIVVEDVSASLGRRCHTQGIAVGAGRVLISCAEKGLLSNSPIHDGHLLVYPTPLGDGDGPTVHVVLDDEFPGNHWGHAVIGQGVFGKAVTDGAGNHFPDEIGMLCPVVNGLRGGIPPAPFNGTPVQLRDRNGASAGLFWHVEQNLHVRNGSQDNNPDFACSALIVFGGRLYFLGLRHQFLYVYELHWFGAANRDAAVVAELIVSLDCTNSDECRTQNIDGEHRNWEEYESVNLLQNEEGSVLLLGAHKEWMDTWHLGVLNPKQGLPTLTKLCISDQNWKGQGKDLFFEGVAYFRHGDDPNRIGFVASPWDYRHSRCGSLGATMCTNLWTWERRF